MEEKQIYQTVILASLLHDIGKFLQKMYFGSSRESKRTHPEFSELFISQFGFAFEKFTDFSLLKTLVKKHHEDPRMKEEVRVQSIVEPRERALAYLISTADNLSSSERGRRLEQWQDYRIVPLASVFSRLSADRRELHYHPRPLDSVETEDLGSILFPEEFKAYEKGKLNRFIRLFAREWREGIGEASKKSFHHLVSYLLSLLYKYTWCIPSNTQEEIPDVSLFDHLKTTAAIAACLYQYHRHTNTLTEQEIRNSKAERFLIACGDISGIQNYIFEIRRFPSSGVARRLRARSLFVQLLSEVVGHLILRELNLPLTNLIMSSGGKFYLLLPNIEKAKRVISRVQREADEWLLKELNGELGLNLAFIPFGNRGFSAGDKLDEGFGKVRLDIDLSLRRRKQNQFGEVLRGEGWREENFLLKVSFEGRNPCLSCGKFPAVSPEGLCKYCETDKNAGRKLPSARYIAFFSDPRSGEIPLLGYSASLIKSLDELQGEPYLVFKLNDPNIKVEEVKHPLFPKYLATYTPPAKDCSQCKSRDICPGREESKSGEMATFDCLAYSSTGRPLLGFLKGDVDRLGETFALGLKKDRGPNFDTISRLSTLSRMLDIFFSGWVEHLLRREFPNCYTIFSGGDDFFIVGPWDEALALGQRIRDDFSRFTGNSLTLSLGLSLTKHNYPVRRAAELVNLELENAKEKRNQISLLSQALGWEEWKIVKQEIDFLNLQKEKLTSSFLFSLIAYGEMWRRYKDGDILGLRFQPLLADNLRRNVDPRKAPEIHEWAKRLLKFPPEEKDKLVLENLGLIARVVILSKEER